MQEEYVGTIKDIENYGANDIITFYNMGKIYTMAYVDDLFLEVDIQNKKIIVSSKIEEVMCEI